MIYFSLFNFCRVAQIVLSSQTEKLMAGTKFSDYLGLNHKSLQAIGKWVLSWKEIYFNVFALENIVVSLTREIRNGLQFLHFIFSCIGVQPNGKARKMANFSQGQK